MPVTYKLKTDPQGMVGRECPRKPCSAYFKVIAPKVYEDVDLTCPNCGNKANVKKYTTDEQITYINSLLFHRDACPVEYNQYAKTPPCYDYVERPACHIFSCDVCGQKFGYDAKPNFCPYCGSAHEHLREESACDLKEH